LVIWKSYSAQALKDRKKLLVDFYYFISQRSRGGIKLWSAWCENKKRLMKEEQAKKERSAQEIKS